MSTTIVNLQWMGPYSFEEVLEFGNSKTDFGIYQFRGPHTAYGNNAMLYIGMTITTFAKRLPGEGWREWQQDRGNVQVYISRIDNKKQIPFVERLLILAHRPSHNSKGLYKNDVTSNLHQMHILNWGNRGGLLPEVSGAR